MDTPYFEPAASWKSARTRLSFQPLVPSYTGGRDLQLLRVHVRDHKRRILPVAKRTLEAHYGDFTLSQSQTGADAARQWELARVGWAAQVSSHPVRVYELGPEPPPDDIDGRTPAVVSWADGDLHMLVVSDTLQADELLRIAASIYHSERSGRVVRESSWMSRTTAGRRLDCLTGPA
jgi:hypothetical protein